MDELPTIKKRRADKQPHWDNGDSDQHEQQLQRTREIAGDFHGVIRCGAEEQIIGGKRASTLKYEQRSGSSQCQLAWNAAGKQQRNESVTDIHLQMMAPIDSTEIESRGGWSDEMGAWGSRGSERDGSIKGRERWLPLQNARDRLM